MTKGEERVRLQAELRKMIKLQAQAHREWERLQRLHKEQQRRMQDADLQIEMLKRALKR